MTATNFKSTSQRPMHTSIYVPLSIHIEYRMKPIVPSRYRTRLVEMSSKITRGVVEMPHQNQCFEKNSRVPNTLVSRRAYSLLFTVHHHLMARGGSRVGGGPGGGSKGAKRPRAARGALYFTENWLRMVTSDPWCGLKQTYDAYMSRGTCRRGDVGTHQEHRPPHFAPGCPPGCPPGYSPQHRQQPPPPRPPGWVPPPPPKSKMDDDGIHDRPWH